MKAAVGRWMLWSRVQPAAVACGTPGRRLNVGAAMMQEKQEGMGGVQGPENEAQPRKSYVSQGKEYEEHCQSVLIRMGATAHVVGKACDGGIDIIGHLTEVRVVSSLMCVVCVCSPSIPPPFSLLCFFKPVSLCISRRCEQTKTGGAEQINLVAQV